MGRGIGVLESDDCCFQRVLDAFVDPIRFSQVELHKKAAKLKLKVIRNRAPVKFVNFCEMAGKPLVSILEERIYLEEGDRLSIVTYNSTAVWMKRDTSQFLLRQILE